MWNKILVLMDQLTTAGGTNITDFQNKTFVLVKHFRIIGGK